MRDLTPCLPEAVVGADSSFGPTTYTWRVSCTRCKRELQAGSVMGNRDSEILDRAARGRAASIASRTQGEWSRRVLREGSECAVARGLREKREGAAEGGVPGSNAEMPAAPGPTPSPAPSPEPSREYSAQPVARRSPRDESGDSRRPMRGTGPNIFARGRRPARSLRPWELGGEDA